MLQNLDVEKQMKSLYELADDPHLDVCVLFPAQLRRTVVWCTSAFPTPGSDNDSESQEEQEGDERIESIEGVGIPSPGQRFRQAGKEEARKVWDMLSATFRAEWQTVEF